MKKILLPLFLLFCIVFPPKIVLAADGTQSATPSPTPIVSRYTLPYPGILPDNPLYFIKVIRDDLVGFFISDPLRKASFYLLQSDKRLASSLSLVKSPKRDEVLILTTLSKSTNYLNQAVGSLREANQAGESVSGTAGMVQQSVVKHLSVIQEMMPLSSDVQKQALVQEAKRVTDLGQQVEQLIQK